MYDRDFISITNQVASGITVESIKNLPVNSLKICNDILPPRQQHEIEKAALFADLENEAAARRCRERAGYV